MLSSGPSGSDRVRTGVGVTLMHALKHFRSCALLCTAVVGLHSLQGHAQPKSEASAQNSTAKRDGQHDFDFEIGTWKTHLRRLQHPLTGSKTWVEYEGTTVVRRRANGRGQP